ncbi:MAG TPA: hypothetical protein VMR90_01210 [Candidatus Cybelea sp.]|nr:hypothetical protein [Candidatus Cybelea sp.]
MRSSAKRSGPNDSRQTAWTFRLPLREPVTLDQYLTANAREFQDQAASAWRSYAFLEKSSLRAQLELVGKDS